MPPDLKSEMLKALNSATSAGGLSHPPSSIPANFDLISGELDQLEDRLNVLASRISPVLSPEEAQSGLKAGEDSPVGSDVAQALYRRAMRIRQLRFQIEDLTNRVEL